jgi:hypothetical protein
VLSQMKLSVLRKSCFSLCLTALVGWLVLAKFLEIPYILACVECNYIPPAVWYEVFGMRGMQRRNPGISRGEIYP